MTTSQKVTAVVGVAAAIGLFFLGWQCHSNRVTKSAGTVKVVRKDSIVYQDKPIPYKVEVLDTVYINGKPIVRYVPRIDTLKTVKVRIDTVPGGCNDVAYYKDVRDSGRVKLMILDTVSQNRLQGRSVNLVFTDSIIKETIVIRPPQKIILFFGVSASGTRKNPFNMAGIDLTLKGIRDRQYVIGANVDRYGKLYGEVGMKWPIRLKSR